jgi:hypothetical protein
MFIPDPDFYPSRIPDPGSRIPDPKKAMKDIGEKKFVSYLVFGVINFTKLNYFIFEMLKKKIWANFQRIIGLYTQKLSLSSQKYGFGIRDPRSGIRDPASGIREKHIPDPGSRGQKGTGSRIPDPDPQHWIGGCFDFSSISNNSLKLQQPRYFLIRVA